MLGSRAPFDVLAILTGRSEEQLIADLRRLVERGLLLEEDDDQFSFRHELVRDAVEDQLLGRQRRRLHERALDALRQSQGADLADLARHAAGAGRYDEMVELARDGVGHYLDIGATHQALRLAVAALAESADDLDLLTGATRAAWLIGAHDEAWGHAERLLALTAPLGGERHAIAVRLAARIAHERSDVDRMWQLVGELEQLVDVLPPGEERAATMAGIAQINMLHDRSADAIEWADRAIGEADRAGAKAVRVQAMIERATAMSELPDRRADGVDGLIEAIAEAEHIEDWVLLARALHNISNVSDGAESRAYLERMRAAGRRAGFDNMAAANYHVRLAQAAYWSGDAPAVADHVSRVGPHVEGRAGDWALASNVRLLLESDRVDEAAALLEAWARRVQPGPDDKHRLSSQHLMLAGRRHDRTAAAQRLAEVLEESWTMDCEEEVVAGVGDAISAGIDPNEVLATLETAKSDHLHKGYEAAARALIAGARADHAEVITLLDSGAGGVTSRLEAPMRATLYLTLARALAAQGRTSEARQQATTARSLLERWPGWRREEVDALLQRLDAVAPLTGS